jgi:hypothetical protein
MKDLINRYVRAVGQYLPEKDRDDVQNELRSQIQDKLDDRFGAASTQDDVVNVLTELGDPARLALAYGSRQYLVGPELYPTLKRVLGYGLVIAPAVAVAIQTIDVLNDANPASLLGLMITAGAVALEAALTFVAVTVLIFFILQHSGYESSAKPKAFNPRELLTDDDPRAVDKGELAFEVATSVFGALLLGYAFVIGGIEIQHNPWLPAGVIPSSQPLLAALVALTLVSIVIHLIALVRKRWTASMWLAETAIELASIVALYLAIFKPFMDYLIANAPASSDAAGNPIVQNTALIVAMSAVVITLITRGLRWLKIARAQQPKR